MKEEKYEKSMALSPKNESPFYYSDEMYERPESEEFHEFFWTSSVLSYNDFPSYVFGGLNGFFGFALRDGTYNSAVRCGDF